MPKTLFTTFFIIFSLLFISLGQQCRNKNNWRVDWWVVLMFPDSVSTGYAYFDSRTAAPSLAIYTEEPDSDGTSLSRTLEQIANLGMYSIAWNDQLPNGSASTTRAHSKSIGAYDAKNQAGFFIVHSVPQYPAFASNIINKTINLSQQKYGQHFLCISGDKQLMLKLIPKLIPIRPYVFQQYYDPIKILNQTLHFPNSPPNYQQQFSYLNYSRNGTEWQMIFKNGYLNSSIFEDGVNNMLGSSIVSQTWGRPLAYPWCGGVYGTGNIKEIKINDSIAWTTTQDHSKWISSVDNAFSCFGDMNRMDSQWTRGGAFYCLKSELLSQALKSVIKTTETCAAA